MLQTQRYVHIDALRGFALCGILLSNNIWSFAMPLFYEETSLFHNALTSMPDWLAFHFSYGLMKGHFWTIFSFMFGFSCAFLYERWHAQQQAATVLLSRRLLFLFIFGYVHLFLIWHGDILHTYAACGFILLVLLRYCAVKGLIIWSSICAAVYPLLALLALPNVTATDVPITAATMLQNVMDQRIFSEGTYGQIVQHGWEMFSVGNEIGIWPIILSMLCFGAAAARANVLQTLIEPQRWQRYFLLLTVVVAVPLLVTAHLSMMHVIQFQVENERNNVLQLLRETVADPLIGISFLIVFIKIGHRYQALYRFFAPLGKQAFTHYVLQSIVMTSVYYGFGAQLSSLHWSMLVHLVIAIGFLVFQVYISRYWATKYCYGPLEWVWRYATLGKRPQWKID